MNTMFSSVMILVISTFIIGILVAYVIKFMLFLLDVTQYVSKFNNNFVKVFLRAKRIKRLRYYNIVFDKGKENELFDFYISNSKSKIDEKDSKGYDIISYYYGQ